MSKLNVVVIGYGFAGRQFHPHLISKTRHLHLYGVVSSRKLAIDIKVFSSLSEALDDPNVHVFIIASPTPTHVEYAIQILNKQKHLVIEKPICLTCQDFQRICNAKSEKSCVSVFQNRRQDGDYLTVKKLIESGKIGKVRWIEASWQKYGVSLKEWKKLPTREGGGYFYDLGVHVMDQILLIFSQAISTVYARIHYDFEGHPGIDSSAMIIVTFEDGCTAVVDVSSGVTIPKPRFSIVGSKGTYNKYGMDPQEAAMINGDIDQAIEPKEQYGVFKSIDGKEEIIATEKGDWKLYYTNFENMILNHETPMVSLESVYRVTRVLEAALRSSEQNQVINVDIPALKDIKL
jgi:scyllo-inositol 2-dehydrogenase (NADP+)